MINYLGSKERKRKRRLSETIRETIEKERREREQQEESETSSQAGNTGTEDEVGSAISEVDSTTGGEEEEEEEEEDVTSDDETIERHFPIVLPDNLKAVLEKDYHLINDKDKLLDLPTDKTALSLLENYVKFFAVRYLARTKEKRRNEIKEKDKCFLTRLDLCKEVMDGIRICFDFHIETLLLYAKERRQAERLRTAQPVYSKGELDGYEPMLVDEKDASENTSVHKDEGDTEDSKAKVEASQKEEEKNKVADSIGHRLLRSKRPPSGDSNTVVEREKSAATNMACESGRSTPTTVTSGTSTAGVSGGAGTNISTSLYRGIPPQLQDWSLLPESHHDPPPPSIIYGHTHLLRLFVKLPEILFRMNLPEAKKIIIIKHLDLFIEYISNHSDELFLESQYINNPDM
ncbi:MSL complex subunit 3 isoform X1 [Cherax quadricarinatus]